MVGYFRESPHRLVPSFASHETQSVFFISVDDRWIGLRNALTGLFCGSLGTSSPTSVFHYRLPFDPLCSPIRHSRFRARVHGVYREHYPVSQAPALQVMRRSSKALGPTTDNRPYRTK
jgi:hypothetical protein